MNNNLFEDILDTAIYASTKAGEALVTKAGPPQKIGEKSPRDVVTEADKICETIIIDNIQKTYPDHQIIAEEAGHTGSKKSKIQWYVDPLDGTLNYLHGIPFSAISIGVYEENIPLVGVVNDPWRKELFHSVRGAGAYLNQKSIKSSEKSEIKRTLIGTELRPPPIGETTRFTKIVFKLLPEALVIRSYGAATLALAYVAAGRLDAYFNIGLWPWDLAGGIALISEAGGMISDLRNKSLDLYSRECLVAGNSDLHQNLVSIITHQN